MADQVTGLPPHAHQLSCFQLLNGLLQTRDQDPPGSTVGRARYLHRLNLPVQGRDGSQVRAYTRGILWLEAGEDKELPINAGSIEEMNDFFHLPSLACICKG